MALEAQENPFPYVTVLETAADGSEIAANPAADYRKLFLGEDGLLYTKDSAGTVAVAGGAAAHIADTSDAHDASAISFTPAGSLSATDVQAAIEEAAAEAAGFADPMTSRGDVIIRNASNVTDRLAKGTAGQALVSDGTDVAYNLPKGSVRSYARASRTSGNVTISSVGSYANVDTGIDLVLAAVAGDLLEVTANAVTAADADQLVVTCSTIVSAAVVNNLASGTSTEVPVHSWSKHSTATTVVGQIGGTVAYIVQSGDISGGNVTIRLRALVGAGSVVINANTNNPLTWWAKVTRM